MNKLEIKINNFTNALQRLKEATTVFREQNGNDVVRDGVIQRFEFTYEVAWKATKEYLESIGIVDKNSPKTVFKEAFSQKLIAKEENWLNMLKDRNQTVHVYKEEMAREIVERVMNCYIKEFEELLNKLHD